MKSVTGVEGSAGAPADPDVDESPEHAAIAVPADRTRKLRRDSRRSVHPTSERTRTSRRTRRPGAEGHQDVVVFDEASSPDSVGSYLRLTLSLPCAHELRQQPRRLCGPNDEVECLCGVIRCDGVGMTRSVATAV